MKASSGSVYQIMPDFSGFSKRLRRTSDRGQKERTFLRTEQFRPFRIRRKEKKRNAIRELKARPYRINKVRVCRTSDVNAQPVPRGTVGAHLAA
jgi:hypothetical protein